MTFELDPDIRLHTRLTLGRGWRLATTIVLWIGGLAYVATAQVSLSRALLTQPVPPELGFQVALIALIITPARAVARLLDLERGGLLDQTRLCGRSPGRLLAAFIVGSTGPFVLLAAVLIGNHLRLGGDVRSVALAILVFGGALAGSLVAYGTLPPAMTPDSRFMTPLLIIFGVAAFLALNGAVWVQQLAFRDPAAIATIAVVAAAVPVGIWIAYRRIERSLPDRSRADRAALVGLLARLVPRAGPPEFMRQLRCGWLSGGAVPTMVAAPIAMLAGISLDQTESSARWFALNATPYALLLIGTFATSATVRRELTTTTFDFVRLTPQRPESVVVSWYAGLALPFWIAALVTALILRFAAPDTYALGWPLVTVGLVLPAVSLAEALQRRKAGTFVWLSWLVGASLMPYVIAQSLAWVPPSPLPSAFRTLTANQSWTPWGLRPELIPVLAAIVAVGVAAGRVRRPDGPALSGPAAAAACFALSLVVGLMAASLGSWRAIAVFPRVAVGLYALLSLFTAEERDTPTAPWGRLGFLGGAAFIGTVAVSLGLSARTDAVFAGQDCETQPWLTCVATSDSLATGLCAALALGIGLLAHELLWRVPALSIGARLAVAVGLTRSPWLLNRFVYAFDLEGRPPQIQPLVDSIDVIALTATFLLVATAHTVVRARSLRTARK